MKKSIPSIKRINKYWLREFSHYTKTDCYHSVCSVTLLLSILIILSGCETLPERITAPQKQEELVENYLMKKKVDTPTPPSKKGHSIVVDTTNQRAWLFENGEKILESPITPGKPSTPTPKGKFWVINKHRDWTSTIYHVPMPYFLRLNPGYFGLHEGPMRIQPASHGCIRLPQKQAQEFFELTPIGTKVHIY